MGKSKCLEGGMKTMEEVESKEKETGNIKHIHPEDTEFLNDHGAQVMVVLPIVYNVLHMSVSEFGLDVKIKEMDHQENQNDQSRMDHELGKERGLGVIIYLIPFATGRSV